MENNEYQRNMQPIFVEPEMVEDIPLTRMQQMKERVRNIRRRMKMIRLPSAGMILTVIAVVVVLAALVAVPALPLAAMAFMLVKCCCSAFRAQTA